MSIFSASRNFKREPYRSTTCSRPPRRAIFHDTIRIFGYALVFPGFLNNSPLKLCLAPEMESSGSQTSLTDTERVIVHKEKEEEVLEVDGSLSVEDLLSTLMKQLKGSDWLKEAAQAANDASSAALLDSNDGRGDGDDIQDVILKKVEEELKKEEK